MSQNLRSLTLLAGIAVGLCVSETATAQTAEDKLSIEALVKSGWQVAGYTSTFDNRSATISVKALQRELSGAMFGRLRCAAERHAFYVNCYELR